MSMPYMGQIMPWACGFAPKGWLLCNGQLMAINQNQALYSLLGTTFGGDGVTTFGLPNLQGLYPAGYSTTAPAPGFAMGQLGGEANHTLTISEMPTHFHTMIASGGAASATSPVGNFPAVSTTALYAPTANLYMGAGSTTAGGSQTHPNMQPYLTLNFCIAITGIFPSRS